MLSGKSIPKSFWLEAVDWVVHVLNRSPTVAVFNKTPEEAWSKIKPSDDYFRVFGYISHVHVPDNKRTKLDDKSFSCVLLGDSEESNAYRLYDPISQKIIISRDVVFKEDKHWDWDEKYKEFTICYLEWGDCEEEATENVERNETYSDPEIEDDAADSAVEVNAEDTGTGSLIQNTNGPQNSNTTRDRRAPSWMRNYETGEGLSD